MSRHATKRKTCNGVNIRQSSLASRGRDAQPRQSSMMRAGSTQAGSTSGGAPATVTPKRPRLNVIASSSGSYACSSALSWPVAGLKLVATARLAELVQTEKLATAALAGFAIATRRVARVQRSVSCGRCEVSEKMASLPPGMVLYDHVPASGAE